MSNTYKVYKRYSLIGHIELNSHNYKNHLHLWKFKNTDNK